MALIVSNPDFLSVADNFQSIASFHVLGVFQHENPSVPSQSLNSNCSKIDPLCLALSVDGGNPSKCQFVAFTGDKGLAPYGLQVVPGRQAGWGQMCLEGLKPEIRQAAGLFVVNRYCAIDRREQGCYPVTEERIYLQRNRIDVTEETFCPTCKKRIGESHSRDPECDMSRVLNIVAYLRTFAHTTIQHLFKTQTRCWAESVAY
ncbi:hypothetical protein BaRGS_00001653, partial [Batillaria attramentaria]